MIKTIRRLFFTYLVILIIGLAIYGWVMGISFKNYYGTILFGTCIAFILSLITEGFYLRPIKKIQEATAKITHGDFTGKVAVRSHDELGDLAHNLNKMSANLQSTIIEITKDKDELKAILSSMVEGVIVIGNNEKILLLSPPVSHMLDLRSKDVMERPYWEAIRNREINATFEEALKNKKAIKKELAILFPSESYFSMQISPILNESGGLSSVVAVFHDISELKKLEKVRSEFVANVSHELKTPLTSIKGFVETLQNGALGDPKTRNRFLDIIQTHTVKLENLVNDLLSLSAIESKDTKMNFEYVSLPDIIDTITNLYRAQLEKRNQNMSVSIPKDIPPILVDRGKIEQVFSNLLDNAIKFTPPVGKILIHASLKDDYIRIDVQDSGIGISEEHLPRVFERFYMVDKSRSKELGGTGLGLAIVKHIVQAHNGRVTVQSELKKGSTFSVFLPKTAS